MSEFTQQTSVARINTLHPQLISPAMEVYTSCLRDKIPIHIIWAYRSNEEQNTMFKYGRTVPGKVITTNRPGYSAHNYRMALDFCLFANGKMQRWEDIENIKYWRWCWIKVIKRFEERGWTSGFRKQYDYDPGHVENLLGKTISELYLENYDQTGNYRNNNIRE